MAQDPQEQPKVLQAVYNQAVKNNNFDGSLEDFTSKMQSDSEFFGGIKNMVLDTRRQAGKEDGDVSDERFMTFVGLEPQKKKEVGSEESSANGYAENNLYDSLIASANESINSLNAVSTEPSVTPVHPAFEEGWNQENRQAAQEGVAEAEKILENAQNQTTYYRGSSANRAGAQSDLEEKKKTLQRENEEAIRQYEENKFGEPAREKYGETGPGVVDEGLNKGSNLLQVEIAVENFMRPEFLGSTQEEKVVPYLNNALGDLGFKFDEAVWGVDGYGVTYPDGTEKIYLSPEKLKTELTESIRNIRVERQQSGREEVFDIPERILTKQEYDRLISRNKTAVDNFSTEEANRRRAFDESMVSMNRNLISYAEEAKSLMGSLQQSEPELTDKKEQIDQLSSELETLNKKYSVEGATEEEARQYKELYNRYTEAYREYESLSDAYNKKATALNQKNQQIDQLSERLNTEATTYQDEAQKRLFDIQVQSYEMNRLISQYADEVLANTWTWYGVAGKSIVNGLESAISGAFTVAQVYQAGKMYLQHTVASESAKMFGLDSVATFIDDVADKREELMFGEDIDYTQEGWLDSVTNRSRQFSGFVDGLSELWGPTTQEAINKVRESGIVGGGVLGALESAPAMLAGPAAPFIFFSMAFESSLDQMSDPRFEGMSDANKLLVATATAAGEAALERLGMPKSLKNTSIFSSSIQKALRESGGSASTFRRALEVQFRNRFKDVAEGTASEALTGGAQYVSGFAIQEISDVVNQQDFFENPDDLEGFVSELTKSAVMEGIGGLMFSGIGEIARGRGKNVTDAIFEPLVTSLSGDSKSRESAVSNYEQALKAQLESKKITQEQFDASMQDVKMLSEIVDRLPKADEGGVAANKVQLRALVELHVQRMALEGSTSEASQKKLTQVNEKIQQIEGQAERTYNILNVQEETANNLQVDLTSDQAITLENLTEQENAELNQVISELKEGNASNVVIHTNQKSASEAGLGATVGGRFEGGTIHINLKAIERNKIEEGRQGFAKLKGFNETIREELNHSVMSAEFNSMEIDNVRKVKNSWLKAAKKDKAILERALAKEKVYKEDFLERAGKTESELTEKEKDLLERELADEVVQEIASFAHTGRMDKVSVNKAASTVGEFMPSVSRNGLLSKIGVTPSIFRKRNRLTENEAIALMKKSGAYDGVKEEIKRNSKGISPASLPNGPFTARIKYPGVTTRPGSQRYTEDRKFKDKWDFVNYIRRLTKDGTIPFFAFYKVDGNKVTPINGYAISGWNFKNSFKPISELESRVAWNEVKTVLEDHAKTILPFESETAFYEELGEAREADMARLLPPYSAVLKTTYLYDLLTSMGLYSPKNIYERQNKEGRTIRERQFTNNASLISFMTRENLVEMESIVRDMSPVQKLQMVDVAKMLYPEAFSKEEVADSVVRNSKSLVGAGALSGINYLRAFENLPEDIKSELIQTKKDITKYLGSDYRDFNWSNYEEIGMLVSNVLDSENLTKDQQAQVLSSLAEYMSEQEFDAADQFKLYNKSKKAYLEKLASDVFDGFENIKTFGPVLDLITAITSNGETESKNTQDSLMIFEMVMMAYERNGAITVFPVVKELEKKGLRLSSNTRGRQWQMYSQLQQLTRILNQFLLDDGSFDEKRFVEWASSYPQRTKRRGFTNLHQSLVPGDKSVDASTAIKIPNYALNLMGVDDILTIDTHSNRAVSAVNGKWKEGIIESYKGGKLIPGTDKSSLTNALLEEVKNQKSKGESEARITQKIKSSLAGFGEMIPIVHEGYSKEISVSDLVMGDMSKAKKTDRSSDDAFWVGFLCKMIKSDTIIRKNAKAVYDKTLGKDSIIKGSTSATNQRESDSLIRKAHEVFNKKRKEQGKSPVSIAGFGQYLFVFGKQNISRRYKPLHSFVDNRIPFTNSRSGYEDLFDGIERVSLYADLENNNADTPNNNFSILNVFRRNGDIDAESYPSYIPGKGVRVFNSFWSKGELIDENLRVIEEAESIEEGQGGEIYVNGRLKLGELKNPKRGNAGPFLEFEIKAFEVLLEASTGQKYTKEQVENIYRETSKEWRDEFVKEGGRAQSINADLTRNSLRLRRTAERKASAKEFAQVKQEILSNPQNYISKQNIKEAKDKLESMTNDELLAIMTDDALGRLSNRNDDLGVLAASELIQRKVASGDMQGVPALIEELAKMGTTAGRLLRHFREMKKSTPEGLFKIINAMVERRGNKLTENQTIRLKRITEDLMYHQNRLKGLIERAISGENVDKEIESVRRDLERAERELDGFVNTTVEKGWGEIGVAIMQGNLLTPMSQFTNIGANLVNALIKAPVDVIAMGVDKVAEAIGMNIDNKHRLSLAAYAYGLRRFGAGFVEAADQIITGKEEAGTEWRVNRGFMPIRSFMKAWANEDLPLDMYKRQSASQRTKLFVQGTLGIPAEVMFRFLSLGDTPFRRMVEGFELYQMGIQKGLEGEELKRFLKYPTKEEQEYAEREGRKLTFQEETTASRAAEDAVAFFERLFERGFDWIPGVDGRAFAKFFVRSNMPYVRTPANILYDTLTFVTPYVAVPRILGSIAKGDNRAASENLAKLIVGTTIMQTTAKLVGLGLISGAVEWNEDEEKNIAYDQFPPNSFNMSALKRWIDTGDASKQEDDVFVGYNKLGVLGAIMGATVKSTTKESVKTEEPFSINKILRDAFGLNAFGSIAHMMDQSFLQGMDSLISVMSASDADDFERSFERWYGSMFQAISSIALPNTLSAYNRATREYLPDTRITRETPIEERLFKKMSYTIRDRINENSKFPVRVDWRGEPISQTPRGTTGFVYQFFDITKSRQGSADEVSQEIWRLYEETEDLTKLVGTPYYATTRKLSPPQLNKRSKKEAEAFARAGGKYTFISDLAFADETIYLSTAEINKAMELSGKERYAMARSLMMSDEYASQMSNEERIEALNDINELFSGFKEIDENGNFRSHTIYLLDVMQDRYEDWLEENGER